MRDAVALWYVNCGSAADIVRAACDLLVAGSDGPSLCTLAAVSIGHADEQVPELLAFSCHTIDLAGPLKRLGYAYDLLDDHPDRTADQVDADVMTEVRRVTRAGRR
jgi:hypothetical protein